MSISPDAQQIDEKLKEVEAKLQLAEAKFAAVAESSSVGVCLIQGRVYTLMNAAYRELAGRDEAELRALGSPLGIVEAADRSRVEKVLRQVMDGGTPKETCRFHLARDDAEDLEVEAVFSALPSEEGPTVLCCLEDISETRRLKESLKEVEERFRYASRASQELIWECTLPNERIWCNEGIMTVFKYSPGEAPKTLAQFIEAVHPEDREGISSGIRSLISAARPFWLNEFRFIRGDGGYAHVLARAFLHYDADRKPIRLIGSMLDHTRQKLLESQFLETQRLSGIGTIAKGLAHDVNNILTPVLTAAQRLKEEIFLNEKQTELLESIEENCLRGSALTTNIMNYAKDDVEEDRVGPIEIGVLIESVALMFRETFPRNIEIIHDASDNLHPIDAEELQFEQILMNLCLHARDAMPHGGTLSIRARNTKLDPYFLLAHQDVKKGPYVLVRVHDEGMGYTPEEQKTLFDPSKEMVTDSFLGLVTVKSLVDKLDGVIEVVSSPSKGTVFEIYLPAAEASEEETGPDLNEPLEDGNGETVLLVDDEPKICELSRESLECHGYKVLTARDGAAAVSLYCQHRADISVVLMDLKMPVMDGATAIRVLRGMNPKIKIIATTGSVRNQSDVEADGLRTDGFLRKPYTTARLLKMLNEVIAVH